MGFWMFANALLLVILSQVAIAGARKVASKKQSGIMTWQEIIKMKEEMSKRSDDYRVLRKKEVQDLIMSTLEAYTKALWGLNSTDDIKNFIASVRDITAEYKSERIVKCHDNGTAPSLPNTDFSKVNKVTSSRLRQPKGPSIQEKNNCRGPKGQKGQKGDPGAALAPPLVETRHRTIYVAEGEETRIECRVKGNPLPQVNWIGTGNFNTTQNHSDKEITSYLVIQNTTWNERGYYECKAKSVLGQDKVGFKLKVRIAPRISVKPMVFGRLNADVTFPECNVIADPLPVINWRKAYGDLPYKRHSFTDNKRIMTIGNVQLEDGGYYFCEAKNSLGVASAPVQFIISSDKFKITQKPPSLSYIAFADPVQLTCGASAYPKPVVVWYEGETKLNVTEHSTSNHDTAVTVTVRRSGNFTCRASSGGEVIKVDAIVKDYIFPTEILNESSSLQKQLAHWLNDTMIPFSTLRLCWRASDSGNNITLFHERCDFRGATITIVKSGTSIFGGYSDVSWRGSTGYLYSEKAFLFALSRDKYFYPMPLKLPLKQNEYGTAIKVSANHGPAFGRGPDLQIGQMSMYPSRRYVTSYLGKSYRVPGDPYCCRDAWFVQDYGGSHGFYFDNVEVFCKRQL